MFRLVIMAAVVLVAGVVAGQYMDTVARAPVAAAIVKSDPAPAANSRMQVVKASPNGHFEVEARVDGRRMAFLIDTGASQIALRASDAARLGFHPGKRDYSVRISTANGEGRAALVQLGMVEVGDIVVRNVPALITPDEAL